MKRSLIVAALVLGAGCYSLRRGNVCDNIPGCDPGCQTGPVCQPAPPCLPPTPPCVPPTPTCPAPQKLPPKPQAAPAPEKPEAAAPAAVGAIAQDILLVPKTVYIPYAAQTPVAVARLSGLTTLPGATVRVAAPERETRPEAELPKEKQPEKQEAPVKPPAAECTGAISNAELLQYLRCLNQRLDAIEQIQRQRMCAPGVPECYRGGPQLPVESGPCLDK
jgi:hypothetical protein